MDAHAVDHVRRPRDAAPSSTTSPSTRSRSSRNAYEIDASVTVRGGRPDGASYAIRVGPDLRFGALQNLTQAAGSGPDRAWSAAIGDSVGGARAYLEVGDDHARNEVEITLAPDGTIAATRSLGRWNETEPSPTQDPAGQLVDERVSRLQAGYPGLVLDASRILIALPYGPDRDLAFQRIASNADGRARIGAAPRQSSYAGSAVAGWSPVGVA